MAGRTFICPECAIQVIGYRGTAGLEPENILTGFKLTLEYDVAAMEFGTRQAADDIPVNRTTDWTDAVGEFTVAELVSVATGHSGMSLEFLSVDTTVEIRAVLESDADVVFSPGPSDRLPDLC